MVIDLHTHTTASDGTLSPKELIQFALQNGIRILSITDHDSIAGIVEASALPESRNIELVPGIELNTEQDAHEIHILGYYINLQSSGLLEKLDRLQQARIQRIRDIVEKLQKLGIRLEFEEIMEYARGESAGRLHIARALKDKKYISDVQEAFEKYLRVGCPAYVPRPRFLAVEAVDLVKKSGGIPVYAHPLYTPVEKYLDTLIEAGLRGMEVYYPDHKPAHIHYFTGLAEGKKLLITGGSDFHGFDSAKYSRLGNSEYPEKHFRELKQSAGR
jgi:predicted metal-dependent phosphoesterase TrpH